MNMTLGATAECLNLCSQTKSMSILSTTGDIFYNNHRIMQMHLIKHNRHTVIQQNKTHECNYVLFQIDI